MMYSLLPAGKFSPSRCMYGNPDAATNTKHRYVVLWKDGVERQLPNQVRTNHATFTLTASSDGQQHLPGFWTTEYSTTRLKYYNGMLKSLYTAHSTHLKQSSSQSTSQPLRGLKPSSRWYQYVKHRDSLNTTSTYSTPGGRTPGGGGPRNPPGRGHPSLPRPWGRPPSSSNKATHNENEMTQSSDINTTIQRMFQQLMTVGQDNREETNTLSRSMREDRASQAQINSYLQSHLAQLSADLAALRHNIHK